MHGFASSWSNVGQYPLLHTRYGTSYHLPRYQARRKAAGGGGKVHPLPRPMLVLCRSIFCGRFVPIGAISSVQQLQSVDRCATAHKVYRVVVLEVQNGKASLTSASRHLFAEHRTKRWMGYSS